MVVMTWTGQGEPPVEIWKINFARGPGFQPKEQWIWQFQRGANGSESGKWYGWGRFEFCMAYTEL